MFRLELVKGRYNALESCDPFTWSYIGDQLQDEVNMPRCCLLVTQVPYYYRRRFNTDCPPLASIANGLLHRKDAYKQFPYPVDVSFALSVGRLLSTFGI